MTALPTPPSRVEQVYDAIVDDICSGRLAPGTPLRQELLAERFNVSRQPVQQALLLLRNHGIVREFGRRGLAVTPLDAASVSHLYQLRADIAGYAARAAAGRISAEALRRGRDIIAAGTRAFADQNFAQSIAADLAFHRFLVEESGNPLLVESTGVIWRNVQRVMGEVLYRAAAPDWIWAEHAAILDAVERGDQPGAEDLARRHAEHGERCILEAMAAAPDQATGA